MTGPPVDNQRGVVVYDEQLDNMILLVIYLVLAESMEGINSISIAERTLNIAVFLKNKYI